MLSTKLLLLSALCTFCFNAHGATFSIKGFTNPKVAPTVQGIDDVGNVSYWNGYWAIDVKTTSPINCNGTTTDSVRLNTMSQEGADGTNYPGRANAQFVAISEIINAAKNGFLIETLGTLFYSADYGGCSVNKYIIYVQ